MRTTLVLAALAVLGSPLAAQEARDSLLFSQTFTTSAEFMRVVLRGGDTYRVELGDRGETRLAPGLVEFRPVMSGVQKPRIRLSMSGDSYEIEVFATAEYEVTTRPPAGRGMTINLYWDANRTEKRHKQAAKDSTKAGKDGE
jgi:hypothetical protein